MSTLAWSAICACLAFAAGILVADALHITAPTVRTVAYVGENFTCSRTPAGDYVLKINGAVANVE